uniref:Uncharacterized protein n=1 Tax=Anopheles atroparvus TaxID=41427 RepID=A0AAG5D1Q9_ANOAO
DHFKRSSGSRIVTCNDCKYESKRHLLMKHPEHYELIKKVRSCSKS